MSIKYRSVNFTGAVQLLEAMGFKFNEKDMAFTVSRVMELIDCFIM